MPNVADVAAKRKKNLLKSSDFSSLPENYRPLLAELLHRRVNVWPYASDKTICEPADAVRIGIAPYELGFVVDDHDGGSPQEVAELLEDVRALYDTWPSATKGHLHRWIYCGRDGHDGLWRLSYRLESSFGELRFTAPTIIYDPERLLALLRGRRWKVDLAGLMKYFKVEGPPLEEYREKIMKGSRDTLVRFAYATALRGGDLDNVRAIALKSGIKHGAIEQTIKGAEEAVRNHHRAAWDAVNGLPVPEGRKSAMDKRRAIMAAVYAYGMQGQEGVSTASHETLWGFARQYEDMGLNTFRVHLKALIEAGTIEHLGYVELGYVRGAMKRRLARLRVIEHITEQLIQRGARGFSRGSANS